MSLTLATLLAVGAATPAALPACSWDRPGHDPYMGDVVAAVDHYQDIPAPTRARLKSRMASRSYDEIVSIRRDAIVGKGRYQSDIRGMHFGNGQVCGTVSRAKWKTDSEERGLVYCEDGHCILVPTVCRNVSRITRDSPAVAGAAAAAPEDGAGGGSAGGAPPGLATAAQAPSGGEAAAPPSFVSGLTPPTEASSPWWSGGGQPGLLGPVALGWAIGGGGGYGPPSIPGGGGVFPPPPLIPSLPEPVPVPEPGAWLLMLGGLGALAWRVRRRF